MPNAKTARSILKAQAGSNSLDFYTTAHVAEQGSGGPTMRKKLLQQVCAACAYFSADVLDCIVKEVLLQHIYYHPVNTE